MHITVNDVRVAVQVTVPLKAEANGKLYDVGTLTFETGDSRTAHLDTTAITDVIRQAEAALGTPAPPATHTARHTVDLGTGTGTATLTHPATCADSDTCPFTAAVTTLTTLTTTMLAIGGTWTCDLTDNGALILLKRITTPT